MKGLISEIKIPEAFLPEKNLENKIHDLTKGYKILHNEDVYDVISREEAEVYYIICMAEEVAKKLGNYCGEGYYKFKDKENKLIIKCQFYPDEILKVYLKKGLFKREKVLEILKDYKTISVYTPGEWKKNLEKLYDIAIQT